KGTHLRNWQPTPVFYYPFAYKGNGIRLVNGHSPYSGRVEVIHNGQWGTVCDDSFDGAEVEVICRMLGLQYGQGLLLTVSINVRYGGRPYSGAYYGQGSGPIWLDDLMCGGKENNIANCRSGGWGIENCAHSEDAGVDCHVEILLYWPRHAKTSTIDKQFTLDILHCGQYTCVYNFGYDENLLLKICTKQNSFLHHIPTNN
ncbi:MSRE-like protein, partial [Mya arenaria]